MNYKATAWISGACPQHVYGRNRERVWAQAIRLLTEHPPGWACLHPRWVALFEHAGVISGNRSRWKEIREIRYEDVPEEQLAWKLRKKKQ